MLSNGIKAALNWINFDSVMSDLTKLSILFRHDIDIIQIFLMISGSFFFLRWPDYVTRLDYLSGKKC